MHVGAVPDLTVRRSSQVPIGNFSDSFSQTRPAAKDWADELRPQNFSHQSKKNKLVGGEKIV